MVDVITKTIIHSPLEKVVSFASDPDNATKWYANIKSVEWKTPRPLTIGSRIAFVAQFAFKRLAYTYEITELTASHLVMRTQEGPFPMETTYSWQKVKDDETLMMLRNRGNPEGFIKLLAPFMSMMMKRANQKDLKILKGILEKEPAITR